MEKIASGVIDALITSIFFLIIPSFLLLLLENNLGVTFPISYLPQLGIMMVVAAFFSGLSKGSRFEGAGVILWSVVSLVYLLLFFSGGEFSVSFSTFAGETVGMNLNIDFSLLFYIMLLVPIIGIVRGVVMLHSRNTSK
jgi:hypothetical protein